MDLEEVEEEAVGDEAEVYEEAEVRAGQVHLQLIVSAQNVV